MREKFIFLNIAWNNFIFNLGLYGVNNLKSGFMFPEASE